MASEEDVDKRLSEVEDLLYQGATRVEFNGRRIDYSQKALRLAQSSLMDQSTKKRKRTFSVATDKGL